MAVTTVTTTMAGAINYTVVTDTSADWPSVANSTYFYDKATKLVHYKNSSATLNYRTINIFNDMFVDYSDEQGSFFRVDYSEVDSALIEQLATEIKEA